MAFILQGGQFFIGGFDSGTGTGTLQVRGTGFLPKMIEFQGNAFQPGDADVALNYFGFADESLRQTSSCYSVRHVDIPDFEVINQDTALCIHINDPDGNGLFFAELLTMQPDGFDLDIPLNNLSASIRIGFVAYR